MNINSLELELARATNPMYQVEITTYEFGRFGENDWASRVYYNECGITATIQSIKESKQHFADQGFYITWRVTRTSEVWNREVQS